MRPGTAATPDDRRPRVVAIRSIEDAETALLMLSAGTAVLLAMRCGLDVQQRALDLLRGWAIGTGGLLDRVSAGVVIGTPAGSSPPRLAAHDLASVVDEVTTRDRKLTRHEEQRLIPLAAAGSPEAQGRLVDAYAELATALADWLRPETMTTSRAVSLAQDELDAITAWPSPSKPLLVTITQRIHDRLSQT